MSVRSLLSIPALGCLAALAGAQSSPLAELDPAAALEPAPAPRPLTVLSRSRLSLGAVPEAEARPFDPSHSLSLEAVLERLAGELPPAADRDVVREDLDPAATGPLGSGPLASDPVAFDVLPGGIVLGREAGPELAAGTPWAEAGLAWDGDLLALRTPDGALHALPAEPLDVLGALLAFAARGEPSDVLIDLSDDHVALATEFVGTPLAELLERADRAPGSYLDDLAARQLGAFKTVLVDREVRLITSERGRPVPAATLELHVMVPDDPLALVPRSKRVASFLVDPFTGRVEQLSGLHVAQPSQALARELVPLARLAGWIGLLRWTERRAPGTLAELRRELDARGDGELSLGRMLRGAEPVPRGR